jgi:hypothetical protein
MIFSRCLASQEKYALRPFNASVAMDAAGWQYVPPIILRAGGSVPRL